MDITRYKISRARLIAELKSRSVDVSNTLLLLKGSQVFPEYDADTYYTPVKYEEVIQYLFGVRKEDVDALIDLETGKSYLISADPTPDDFFISKFLTKEDAISIYGVDDFTYHSGLRDLVQSLNPKKIFLYKGIDSYSHLWSNYYDRQDVIGQFKDIVDEDTIYPILNELRCLKNEEELELFRKVCRISSAAHVYCIQMCIPGLWEYQIAAAFEVILLERIYEGECRGSRILSNLWG